MRNTIRRLLGVASVDVCNPTNSITFHFTAPNTVANATVCREWIIDNDVALRHKTGQKTHSIYDIAAFNQLEVGRTNNIERVDLKSDVISFTFDGLTAPVNVRTSDVLKYLVGKPRLPLHQALKSVGSMHRVPFSSFTATTSDAHVHSLIRLAKDGLILVQQCPNDDKTVFDLCRAIDREMPTLYDTSFKVVTAPTAGPRNNVAYSNVELDLHQDLAYHESMPGLQLLHCQSFPDDCRGGESTFMDLIHVANNVKASNPKAFKTLCEVPAAFMKDDFDRPVPAQYYYATPHIHVNDHGDVLKCFWAPAFEAPLPATPRMAEYYEARRAFANEINRLKTTPYYLQFRLQEGDCVIFHQARLLHGRREFSESATAPRQLHGAYVNVDSFRNAVVTRAMLKGIPTDDLPGFANRSYR